MKKFILAAAVCATSLPAMAQSTADGFNWGGVYVGLAASYIDGKNRWDEDGSYKLDGRTRGAAFVGYNQQHGRFVFGLEAANTFGKFNEDGYPDYRYKNMQDFRVRVGHTYDRVMIYLAGGYSRARFAEPDDRITMNGFNLGLGVDYALTDHLIVGFDYTHRRFKRTSIDNDHIKGRVDSASLRLSYLF